MHRGSAEPRQSHTAGVMKRNAMKRRIKLTANDPILLPEASKAAAVKVQQKAVVRAASSPMRLVKKSGITESSFLTEQDQCLPILYFESRGLMLF